MRNMAPRLTPMLGTTSTWRVTVPGTMPRRSSGTTTSEQTSVVVQSWAEVAWKSGLGSGGDGAGNAPAAGPAGRARSPSGNAASARAERNLLTASVLTTRADGSGFSAVPPGGGLRPGGRRLEPGSADVVRQGRRHIAGQVVGAERPGVRSL